MKAELCNHKLQKLAGVAASTGTENIVIGCSHELSVRHSMLQRQLSVVRYVYPQTWSLRLCTLSPHLASTAALHNANSEHARDKIGTTGADVNCQAMFRQRAGGPVANFAVCGSA